MELLLAAYIAVPLLFVIALCSAAIYTDRQRSRRREAERVTQRYFGSSI